MKKEIRHALTGSAGLLSTVLAFLSEDKTQMKTFGLSAFLLLGYTAFDMLMTRSEFERGEKDNVSPFVD
jgi:hypothetical protein